MWQGIYGHDRIVEQFRRSLAAGRNSVKFTGRIGRRGLAVGSYRASLVATDVAGNKGKAVTAKFTVVRR